MLAANVIWGMMSPLGKGVLNSPDIAPLTLTGLRIAGAALLFWIGSLCLPKTIAPRESIARADWLPLCIAALLIPFANQMCIIYGMSFTSPIDATMMFSTTPFFTLLLAWLLYRTRHGWAQLLGVALGFGGMLVFILGSSPNIAMNVSNPILGDALCIASQVFGAVFLVRYAFLTRKYAAFTLMKWLFTIASIPTLAVTVHSILATQWSAVPSDILIEAVALIVCGTVAYVFLPVGQRTLSPTSIAVYNYLQPVVAAIFSVAIGIATVSLSTAIGTALIFSGVALVNARQKAKKQ